MSFRTVQKLSTLAREFYELGPKAGVYRVGLELQHRLGLMPYRDFKKSYSAESLNYVENRIYGENYPLNFTPPPQSVYSENSLKNIQDIIDAWQGGRWWFFFHRFENFSKPTQWHYDPLERTEYSAKSHWSEAKPKNNKSDIKTIWEPARFSVSYVIARASAASLPGAERARAYHAQVVEDFIQKNPYALGPHWASGQEIAFRVMAWGFLGAEGFPKNHRSAFSEHILDSFIHIERHLNYARFAVYNNHFLSESLALLIGGLWFPKLPDAKRWQQKGLRFLDEGIARQFYEDGGYIQQSHNYHRVAIQILMWAIRLLDSMGDRNKNVERASQWRDALRRSCDFLEAHCDILSGELPNYGANDGALINPLSSKKFSDFRPTLVAARALLSQPTPFDSSCDEEALWHGQSVLRQNSPPQTQPYSISFLHSGHHMICARDTRIHFRCGTLKDRFTQMDMLHVDARWSGQALLCDPGSYRYNGNPESNRHFVSSSAHNTLTPAGLEQMEHPRTFKLLYPAPARLLDQGRDGDIHYLVGEHRGFCRHGQGVHRRAILLKPNAFLIVADHLPGEGQRRVHYLLEGVEEIAQKNLGLKQQKGLRFQIFDGAASALDLDVVQGGDSSYRGWMSRHYAERKPLHSVAAYGLGPDFLTVISAEEKQVENRDGRWFLDFMSDHVLSFKSDFEHLLGLRYEEKP